MSFAEQERALFDLLFDRPLREHFLADSTAALGKYELDAQELADFRSIRPAALAIDARMRVYMVLSQLCRELPLSFALATSLPGAGERLRSMVDLELMQVPVAARAQVFAARISDWIADSTLDTPGETAMLQALVGAERSMVSLTATLHGAGSTGADMEEMHCAVPQEWLDRPAGFAAHVAAVIIPKSYSALKNAWCPHSDEELWSYLDQHPLSAADRQSALSDAAPRLLIVRATSSHPHRCVAKISRRIVELSDGFAPLMRYIDGRNCVADILQQLRHSGAAPEMVAGVQEGFRQLCAAGMIRTS